MLAPRSFRSPHLALNCGQQNSIFNGERYDEARPTAGATGALAAGVRAEGVASVDWFGQIISSGLELE